MTTFSSFLLASLYCTVSDISQKHDTACHKCPNVIFHLENFLFKQTYFPELYEMAALKSVEISWNILISICKHTNKFQ